MADDGRIYSQFLDLCKQNNISIQAVEDYFTRSGGKLLGNIVRRHTDIMERLKEQKTEIVRRIKQAEDIAEINEAEIEEKLNEEIVAKILKMDMVLHKLERAIVENLSEEYDMEQIEEKKLKEADEENLTEEYGMEQIEGKLNQPMVKMKTEENKLKEAYVENLTTRERLIQILLLTGECDMEQIKKKIKQQMVKRMEMEKLNQHDQQMVKMKTEEKKLKEADVESLTTRERLIQIEDLLLTGECDMEQIKEKINQVEEELNQHDQQIVKMKMEEKKLKEADVENLTTRERLIEIWLLTGECDMEQIKKKVKQQMVKRVEMVKRMEMMKIMKMVKRMEMVEMKMEEKKHNEADVESLTTRDGLIQIEGLLLTGECDMEQIKEKTEEKKLKETDVESLKIRERLIQIEDLLLTGECDMEQIKEKINQVEEKLNQHDQQIVKMKTEVEKEIMRKIKRMIELEYEERTKVELMEKLTEAKYILTKVHGAMNRENIKEAEIIKKIKNMIEAEYLERMVAEIMRNEFARELNVENIIKVLDEKNTPTMAAGSTSKTKHPKIGTVRRAACNLFNASMERCNFNIVKQQALIVSCAKEEYDDYTCGNVLRIWPELKKKDTKLEGPKDVGQEIIRNLQQSDMIEGTPSLHSVGFITFKISGKWMAKRIHRMLIEGIETWAPVVSLERAIVDFPPFDKAEGIHMDMLRRRYISRSLTHMLQYCQVHVLNNANEATRLIFAQEVIKIEVIGEGMMVYYNDEGEVKSFICNSIMESDLLKGNALKDLGALWHGAEKLKAQWLLYVTPVAKQEYVNMCFTAAKGAGWLSTAPPLEPCATYVGYRSCTTKLEKLVYMLNKAKALHKVAYFVLQGNAANYTARDVLECAIQYTLLKTHRMANCTFDVDEILHEEGNTFLYLLKTQARILSITNKSRRDIRELKKATLILEKDDVLEQGEERDLGFKILDLTEVLVESCFPVLPHNLCRYLYDLCQIFNRYFVSTLARGWRSRFFLLLCEATAVVMQKCFHLLDITPQPLKNELGVTPLIYAAQLSVEQPINVKELEDASAHVGRDPPNIQNPRFEPFSIHLRINPNFESDMKLVKLFGYIDATDTCGLRSDGWTSTHRPDVSYIDLFRRPWNDPIEIINGGCASFGNPSCSRSLPLSSQMRIAMNLVAINEEENDFFPICNTQFDKDFSTFLASKLDGMCDRSSVESEVGKVQINYILLKDAVDATLEVTFKTSLQNLEVCGAIDAYYESGFPLKCGAFEKTFYTTSLFELDSPSILKSGPIKLQKSRMAVPRKGSLKVKAHLTEGKSWNMILSDSCNFRSQTSDSIKKCLKGTNCSLEVKVTWSYCQGS